MEETEKIEREIFPSNTKDVAKILENLDRKSIVLAGVYLKAPIIHGSIRDGLQDWGSNRVEVGRFRL